MGLEIVWYTDGDGRLVAKWCDAAKRGMKEEQGVQNRKRIYAAGMDVLGGGQAEPMAAFTRFLSSSSKNRVAGRSQSAGRPGAAAVTLVNHMRPGRRP
jgi:hypothetical protein